MRPSFLFLSLIHTMNCPR